jgi:DNA-binding NarL/FixJ family response regulator
MAEPLRVLVYARYPSVRAGLGELLRLAGIDVAGEFDGVDVGNADAMLADLAGGDETRDALETVEAMGLPAVLLVGRLPPGALDARQPRGWLTQEAGAEEIAAALRAVTNGMLVVDPTLVRAAELDPAARGGGAIASLSERETQVLGLVAVGLPNKAIGLRLGISEHTVKFHVASLLSKLDAHSRAEAVATAAREGLLHL